MPSALARLAVICLLALPLAAPADQPWPLARLAPEECLFYIECRDLGELAEKFEQSPFHALYSDPRFEAFFKPLREIIRKDRETFEREQRMPLERLREWFPGEAAFFISELRHESMGSEGVVYRELNQGILLRFEGETDSLFPLLENTLFADLPSNTLREVKRQGGVDIYTVRFGQRAGPQFDPQAADREPEALPRRIEPGTVYFHYEYAVFGDYFALLEGQRAFLEKIVANHARREASDPPGASLAATPNFRAALRRLRNEPQLLAYANIQRYGDILRRHPAGASWPWDNEALALEELLGAALGLELRPEGLDLDLAVETQPRALGLARLFTAPLPARRGGLALAPATAHAAGQFFFDLPAAVELMGRAQPGNTGALDLAASMLRQGLQMDLREDLVQLLGQDWSFHFTDAAGGRIGASPHASDGVLTVASTNGPRLAANLARLIDFMLGARGGLERVEETRLGFPVHILRPRAEAGLGPEAGQLCFAALEDRLLVSNEPAQIEASLALAAGRADEKPLPATDDYRRARDELDPEHRGHALADLARMGLDLLDRPEGRRFVAGLGADFVEPRAMPEAEAWVPYLGRASLGLNSEPGYWGMQLHYRYPGNADRR